MTQKKTNVENLVKGLGIAGAAAAAIAGGYFFWQGRSQAPKTLEIMVNQGKGRGYGKT